MAKPGIIYRINCQCFDESSDVQLVVDISDNDNLIDDGDDPQVTTLSGTDKPFTLSCIDNDEDTFSVIKSLQATVQFLSDSNTNMSTFVTGSDERWGVHAYIGSDTIFKGFVAIGDISEAFMPVPNVVQLTCTDNVGTLKDVPLVNADGDNPSGYHRLIDYITWALRQTGLELDLYAVFNIKNAGDTDDISTPNTTAEHFLYKNFVDAKTFEDSIGKSISCYDTIERILAFEASLFQRNGAWWIVRRDEMEDEARGLYVSKFDSSGSFVSNLGDQSFSQTIEKGSDIFLSQAATLVRNDRPRKSVQLNYLFESPEEMPCNSNFERGDYIADVSATEKTYEVECWTLRAGFPGGYISADGTTATIHRKYDANGYEKERFVVLTPRATQESGSSQPTYITSEAIPVSENDKFSASVDWRLSGTISTGGDNFRLFRLILAGDDGSYWILGRPSDTGGSDDTVQWYDTAGWTLNTARGVTVVDYDTIDETEWQTISWDVPPIPTDGNLYIWLNQFNQKSGSDDNKDIHFSNLSLTYIPYINGTYQKYSSQYHRTEQTGDYKEKIEAQVYISDSPKKIFKGALFWWDGSAYVLAGNYYNAAVFPAGPPDSTYEHPYGQIQLFDVWNQYRRNMRLFDFTLQGLNFPTYSNLLHLIHYYFIDDTSTHTNNKMFALMYFAQDFRLAEMTGLLREVADSTINKDYSNHEFKYKE